MKIRICMYFALTSTSMYKNSILWVESILMWVESDSLVGGDQGRVFSRLRLIS